MSKAVAIIGAGVSGLSCGIALAEAGIRATIMAHETGMGTTSAAAAAIWYPYDAEPADRVIAWALETHGVLTRLANDPTTGVLMCELRVFARANAINIPSWAAGLGARRLEDEELSPGLTSGRPSLVFADGFALMVPLTDTTLYLDYLRRRFQAGKGIVREGERLNRLEEVSSDFDSIVHCAGIGARELGPDSDLEPHRGQVAIVPKFELPYAVVCDDPPLMYAVPRTNDCLLGGTNDVSDDRSVIADDTSRIVAECSRVLGIAQPKVSAERVGLRPFRKSGVRLEAGTLRDGRRVVHNYGHGGSGFTLSWGCAREVAAIFEKAS